MIMPRDSIKQLAYIIIIIMDDDIYIYNIYTTPQEYSFLSNHSTEVAMIWAKECCKLFSKCNNLSGVCSNSMIPAMHLEGSRLKFDPATV